MISKSLSVVCLKKMGCACVYYCVWLSVPLWDAADLRCPRLGEDARSWFVFSYVLLEGMIDPKLRVRWNFDSF